MKHLILLFVCLLIHIQCTPLYQVRKISSLSNFDTTDSNFSSDQIFDTITYAPSSVFPEINQIKTLLVNFHFIYDEQGRNNVPEDLTQAYIEDALLNMNARIQENAKMNLPLGNNTEVLPGNFQTELHFLPNGKPAIYHHFDDEHYWGLQYGKNQNNYSRKTYEKYKINEDSVLNIFIQAFPEDSIKVKSSRTSSTGISFKNHIKLIGVYKPEFDDHGNHVDYSIKYYWDFARLLQHEIGHTFGLNHAWTRVDGCEDTPSNPNCWNRTRNGTVCDSLWSNNLMDYNAHQIAMTPCQIAKIQLNINKESSQVKKFIKKEWCDINQSNPTLIVNRNIVLNGERDFDRNIIIEKGWTLVLRNRLSMPANSSILIKAGATLVLDGARIHNSCGDSWSGIKIEDYLKERGALIVLNGSSLEDVL